MVESSRLIFLVNDEARLVKVSYDSERDGSYDENAKAAKTYTFKTLNPRIKVGDYVVVPTSTRHGLTVCKVAEVDCEIDLEATSPVLKWIVGVVDHEQYKQLLEMEQQMLSTVWPKPRSASIAMNCVRLC